MDLQSLRALMGGGVRQLGRVFGVNLYRYAADRRVLEDTILPYLAAQSQLRRLLWVGCAWYTRHYPRMFRAREFWTIDRNPRLRRYGADRHIVGELEDVGRHFPAGGLDAIVCNGLLGWGLDDQDTVERAFDASVDCLRLGGVFIVGWDDIPMRRPCRPEECESLQRLEPLVFPPLGTARHRTRSASRHTYDFYVKDPIST